MFSHSNIVSTPPGAKVHGFSLIEMAIVLFIIALLLGGLLPTVGSQIDQQRTNETRKQLDEIQQALIGYAITNGRLPCPSSDITNGNEDPVVVTGICTHPYDGFVPAVTLGFTTGVDSQGRKGFAVDSWGNRIRYAVTQSNTNAFTKTNGMSTTGIATLAPDLQICSTAASITGAGSPTASCDTGPPSTSLTSGVPVVIYSTGKNGGYGGNGTDEKQNPNPNGAAVDRLFINHTPTPSPNEFDDIVIWISPNILINRMVTAGKLP